MRTRMGFYFSEAFRSLSTNKATSFAAVIAMLVALMIVGVTAAGFTWARSKGSEIQQQAGIVKVFLKETATDEQVNALRIDLERNSLVDNVEFVSKQDALERARKLFKDTPGVMENLPGNPFPASLDAKLKDPTQMSAVAKTMQGQPGVDDVGTGGEKAEKAINVIQIVTVAMFAIGIGILIAATVLVANTIRLSIYSRRREIEVMKLVGASNGFVRMPFMIEGFLCGVFAAVLAMIAVFGAIKVLSSAFGNIVDSDGIASSGGNVPTAVIALGLLVLGIALGMFGSASSMRKYLKT
ncbi:MAG: ABC transporter permease [Thermoleophilia bacterium]|nr:ABC transporter permease [Thermoleophilia bacterium]